MLCVLYAQLDRVWGRGDGAILQPKFTGIAVFVSEAVAPFVRILGVYKHSFGKSEGSKGGVCVNKGLSLCVVEKTPGAIAHGNVIAPRFAGGSARPLSACAPTPRRPPPTHLPTHPLEFLAS